MSITEEWLHHEKLYGQDSVPESEKNENDQTVGELRPFWQFCCK